MTLDFKDASSCWKEILSDVSKTRDALCHRKSFARENTASAKIVFGTSG